MASITTAGILTETTSNTLNRDIGTGASTFKRKRIRDDAEHVFQSFTIKPHHSSIYDKPILLTPLFSIPRECLPLSYLSLGDDSLPLGSSRLFSATIDILDRELEQAKSQLVLIARFSSNANLFAVEWVQHGIYALCALGAWVKEEELRLLRGHPGSASQSSFIEYTHPVTDRGNDVWWTPAKLDEEDLQPSKKLAGSRMKAEKLLRTYPTAAGEIQKSHTTTDRGDGAASHSEMNDSPVQGKDYARGLIGLSCLEQTTQEVFEKVRLQYLETLYISKTSVAYFAKGPLARARTAVMSGDVFESKLMEFVELLRDATLPLKKLDKKYKDALPSLVKECRHGYPKDGQEAVPQPKKRRKSKKTRLGKNAMYPDEGEFVARWWKGRSLSNPGDSFGESHESDYKQLLAELRFRETQLQILLILEILALENSPSLTKATEGNQDGVTSEALSSTVKAKKKKQDDLKSLLDLLLDRLCIWQSLATDQIQPFDGAKRKGKGLEKRESDFLRDFYAEVVVPFYASRLPDHCKDISRKLGGLTTVSPIRPPLAKAASMSQVLPGTSMRRERPEKQRRSLQRVLTDEKWPSQQRPPLLMRSNTAPANHPVKREEVDPIKPGSRGGIQKPKRTDNREVDFIALSKQHETKLRKMNALRDQKKELDEAINALRKPNRGLVSKNFADSVVQRTSASSRKRKNPLRDPSGIGVQVMATPKVNRKRDAGTRRLHAATTHPPDPHEPHLPSSISHIPSSAIRPGPAPYGHSDAADGQIESRIQARNLYTIQETPSRGPSRQSDPLGLKRKGRPDEGRELPLPLPPVSRSAEVSTTPFKVPAHPSQTPRAKRQRLLVERNSTPTKQVSPQYREAFQQGQEMGQRAPETPLKPASRPRNDDCEDELAFVPASSPPILPGPQLDRKDPGTEKSIYESLGWDDYDDIDELA